LFTVYNLFKKCAFCLDPEVAHEKSMSFLAHFPLLAAELFSTRPAKFDHSVEIANLTWKFPIGLAAGLDKNGVAIDFFSRLNFGAIEIGTVTPLPQAGNERPRMFRLKSSESLRNMMGFNNLGAEKIYENVKQCKKNGKILGVNLGKNKSTSQENAWEDYLMLYQKFAPISDYLVINVSSPNTPGLRHLQGKESLKVILESLKTVRAKKPTPLFVKISPDLSFTDIPEIIELASDYKLAGLIATNTTIMSEIGAGGVSGKLLLERASAMRKFILEHKSAFPELELIGVGGISSFEDLWDFWQGGGKVAQIYTSFIYRGPEILWKMQKSIDRAIEINGHHSLKELLENIKLAKRPF